MRIDRPLTAFLLAAVFVWPSDGAGPTRSPRRAEGVPVNKASVSRVAFGRTAQGEAVESFTLRNAHGLEVRAITYGGIIVSLRVPDREGNRSDVVLGHDDLGGYLEASRYFGAIIGRYGNRIAHGRFTLDGRAYQLPTNNGPNHLHGGPRGFDKVVWKAESFEGPEGVGVVFRYRSPDGDQGYPGNLDVRVTYTLTDRDELSFDYSATTDKATPVNLTQHSYFNLAGEGTRDVLEHKLMVEAERFTPVDATLIPTGVLAPVAGTPFDFRKLTAIGARIGRDDEQLKNGGGYDHNFVLNRSGPGLVHVARLLEPGSGRVMDISTTEPGLQFYSGNFLDGSIKGKGGRVYAHRFGLCLETQHFPDSPNRPEFPSTILRPGQEYRSRTVLSFSAQAAPPETSPKAGRDYPIQPVPFTAVRFNDAFWAPRIEVNRTVTVPFALQKCEESKRVYHFERAATVLRGETLTDKTPPGYPFDDSDLYKVIEGAAYTLSVRADPKLEAYLDDLIGKIAAAQEKDGYLYTTRTIDPANPHRWAGKKRWELEKVDSHELYNLGHLYEAAVAHYQATGKRTLLDVAIKTADLLERTFGPGKQSIWPGHQITEMGLVKLYRVTGDLRYLNLAKFLLDVRGPDGAEGAGREYNQSHQRVVDQSEAVGHAVRATYMYSGMADVAALTGETAYVKAIDRIWDDVAGRKLYVTGGIGARGSGEAFGPAYELPNLTAYNETCAAVGNDYWNHRLFLLHGDARYIDVMERTLYNGLLSGVSLDGKSFFYPNPLESNGQHQRSPWFGVACCPANITRFLASIPGYVYAQQGDTLYVNLFVTGTAEVKLDGGRAIKLVQETRYPWDGAVRIGVEPDRSGRFTIAVRIPGWARNEVVPSDLYRFLDRFDEPAVVKVGGKTVPLDLKNGYVRLDREWKRGDVIELALPMPVRRVAANEAVSADRGRMALQRGPLVYAAEWPDNPEGHVRNLLLSDDGKLTVEFRPDLLNGVTVIKGKAIALAYDGRGQVSRREQDLIAIPYYAWANRGAGEMTVWIPDREENARPLPLPTIASKSKVTTSGGRNPRAINDQEEPRSSADASASFFHWWPRKGTTEWVEYAFDEPAMVSETEVYWADDTGTGQIRVPASCRVFYRDGDEWKPVEEASPAGLEKDRYNKVGFKPVKTEGLRLEVTLQPEWSAGIQEWKVK